RLSLRGAGGRRERPGGRVPDRSRPEPLTREVAEPPPTAGPRRERGGTKRRNRRTKRLGRQRGGEPPRAALTERRGSPWATEERRGKPAHRAAQATERFCKAATREASAPGGVAPPKRFNKGRIWGTRWCTSRSAGPRTSR